MSGQSMPPLSASSHFSQIAFNNDLMKTLLTEIEKGVFKYIILDFLDERFDVAELNGGYYTISEAFVNANIQNPYRTLNRMDVTTVELWKDKCLDFIAILSEQFNEDNIILVKNYLAESYGTEECQTIFCNIREIRQLNAMIGDCYAYFEANYPGIRIIDLNDFYFVYSDRDFRHGCAPWHYNQDYYVALRDKILKCLL